MSDQNTNHEVLPVGQHLLDTLTDEEIAAIRDGDGDDDEVDTQADTQATDASTTTKAAAAEAAAPEKAPDAPAPSIKEAPAEAAQAPAPTPAPVPEAAPEPSPPPRAAASLPEDFSTRKAALQEQKQAIRAQLRSGEIDVEAFDDAMEKLKPEEEALFTEGIAFEVEQRLAANRERMAFQQATNALIARALTDDGVDYKTDTTKADDWNGFVMALSKMPANQEKSADWFVAEAHKRVLALHGIAAKSGAAPATAQQAPSRKVDIAALAPKGLAQVPGSDGPGDLQGEFAELDRLDGEQYEDALARLTPNQRARYLSQS